MNTHLQAPTVILGGGDYPSHHIPLSILQNAEQVICCDGAAYDFLRHGGRPWRIVGDCDSLFSPKDEEEKRLLEENRDIIRRNTSQDNNDQTKAVNYCLNHGLKDIIILGATGRREDHTLGNISLLIEYLRSGANVCICTDHGVFIPCHNNIQLEVKIPEDFITVSDTIATRKKSTQVSIFNISAQHFQAKGLRYPLYDFTQWWQGTLNEAISSPIAIEADGDFLIFINFE